MVRKALKKGTSSNFLKNIDVAKERIKDLQVMNKQWENGKLANSGYSKNPFSQVLFSLMIDNESLSQLNLTILSLKLL